MGCNCKTIQKVGEKFQLEDNKREKRNGWYYIKAIVEEIVLNRVINTFFLALVCIIVMPILFIVIIFSQIIFGRAKFFMPNKITNKIIDKAKPQEDE